VDLQFELVLGNMRFILKNQRWYNDKKNSTFWRSLKKSIMYYLCITNAISNKN